MFKHPAVKWIAFGCSGFIAENIILSENRGFVIEKIGDERYHQLYNTLSTIACSSILYGYFKWKNKPQPVHSLWNPKNRIPLVLSRSFKVLGLVGITQTLPKLQSPFQGQGKSRCPIEFTSKDGTLGMKRITRHPMMFSLGFLSLGYCIASPFTSHLVLFSSPMIMAFILGAHQDSRFRRGIGGELQDEKSTSLVPFWALITGNQSWNLLVEEFKPLNGIIAILISMLI